MGLSASLGTHIKHNEAVSTSVQTSSAQRKQLHILYLLNDLLHHTKFHNESSSAYSTLTGALQPHLVDLFGAAAAYNSTIYSKQHIRIGELLQLWQTYGYYQPSYIQKLKETVTNAAAHGYSRAGLETKTLSDDVEAPNAGLNISRKNAPYIMPATHGDSSAPFYDLPAGNMMPHIVPNTAIPINPQLVKPLQFVAGPADESLVIAIKTFLKDVDILYPSGVVDDDTVPFDIDELGRPIVRDEVTGEPVGGEGYYGWSKVFCGKMKQRRDGKDNIAVRRPRSRTIDSDRGPQKRRRYSFSEDSRSRSRGRSRSSTVSRSIPRLQGPKSRDRSSGRSFSRSRSSSRTNRSLNQHRYRSLRSRSQSHSRSRSYSPPQRVTPPQQRPLDPVPYTHGPPALPPSILNAYQQGVPLGPGGVPIPPPPPNYVGPWPPPPPPLIPNTGRGNPFPGFPTFIHPPPHPPLTGHGNSGSPPFSSDSNPTQSQSVTSARNWGSQGQHQPSGNGGYGMDLSIMHSPANGQGHGNRGREGRGGRGR